jgi:hypothetical protein
MQEVIIERPVWLRRIVAGRDNARGLFPNR